MSGKAKPKRARVRPDDFEILDAKSKTGGKTVLVHGDGSDP